jgi:hypothetical protein
MAADPAALQLRLLQTVVEVAAEKNSTLVMPFPVELLRFFDRARLKAAGQPSGGAANGDGTSPPELAPAMPPVLTLPEALPADVTCAPLNAAPKAPAAP